ncbi:hypothetical protein CEXT_79661 [Caerostris extrusa]|uniref:Uncharacterized protein n=1 Tax=Caerostris extrusa TaxID=172846 RepID=A0AAV4UX43_CAEEX|nr:hypothetical protein CEXT_79661 [Caerostris extrusa]
MHPQPRRVSHRQNKLNLAARLFCKGVGWEVFSDGPLSFGSDVLFMGDSWSQLMDRGPRANDLQRALMFKKPVVAAFAYSDDFFLAFFADSRTFLCHKYLRFL